MASACGCETRGVVGPGRLPLPTRPFHALATDHNSRAVGQISLVDEHEHVLCNLYVRPEQPVVSYLTPLTGLSQQLLAQHGMPLAQAVALLLQCLPNTAILVGQNIAKDVEWLGLKEGLHFEQASRGQGMGRPWCGRGAPHHPAAAWSLVGCVASSASLPRACR